MRARFVLALLAGVAIGCGRENQPEAASTESSEPKLDVGAIRVAIVDGLEAAARDPSIAGQLGLAAQLETPDVVAAVERLLARAANDPELARAADEFFAALQDSPAMRAALLEHARQNPEFIGADLSPLRETFKAEVERRLTREQLVELLEQQLRIAVRERDEALAQAWLFEAGAGSALAGRVLERLDDPRFRSELSTLLGRDLQAVLERRFSDPKRAARLLLDLPAISPNVVIEILDHERTASLLAAALARALRDPSVRERCEALFALALAAELDAPAFTQTLERLLDEPALAREVATFTTAVARENFSRQAITAELARLDLDAQILRSLE